MAFSYLNIFLCLWASAFVVSAISEEEETRSCEFQLGGQFFDLCPLFGAGKPSVGWTVETEENTLPTVTKIQYRISPSGPLSFDNGLPAHLQCPIGTWICMTMSHTRPGYGGRPPRILQHVPVAGQLASLGHPLGGGLNLSTLLSKDPIDGSRHESLSIRYHGGHHLGTPQHAEIRFVCDETVDEPTSPTFLYRRNGQHGFLWKTKHACTRPMLAITSEEQPEDQDGTPAKGEEENSTELIDPSPMSGRALRAAWILALSSSVVIGLLVYLVYYPPPLVRRYVYNFLKSRPSLSRFRVDESILLRWAEEDMAHENDDEDLMVNGGRDPIFVADDEQIPLRPSPRRGGRVNYGSTR